MVQFKIFNPESRFHSVVSVILVKLRSFLVIATFLVIIAGWLSCQPEEQIFTFDPSADLRFSADTVLFDTVFTDARTVTKRFNVYNDHPRAVNISSIQLGGGNSSSFDITVNGSKRISFENLRLLGGDSILVLVEAFIDPRDENLPYVVEDSVIFETNGNDQMIRLVAWGQDAHYFNDSILACNTTWTNERPYVIYNSILIDSLCTWTIEPGTSIFSHKGSSIFIKGSIQAEGLANERITFRNDRVDDNFENAPGQWDGIFFLEGSQNNHINYTDIRNAEYGIWLGTPDNDTIPDLVMESVKIENMSRSGLIAFTSDLEASNCLINNCADFAVGNLAGGNYRYVNCTFANYSFLFFRENPAFAVTDNLLLADGNVLSGDIKLELINSIIWGDQSDEIILNNDGGKEFQAFIAHSILKTTSEEFDINSNQLNEDPLFINPQEYDYHLDSLSPAIDAGLNFGIATDLDGVARDSIPDLGSYEWISGNQ